MSDNNNSSIFDNLSNFIISIFTIIGFFISVLFIINLYTHHYQNFHYLTDKWYVITLASSIIVKEINI